MLGSTNALCLLMDQALESRYKDLPTDSDLFKLTILPAFDSVSVQNEDIDQTEAFLQRIELLKHGEHADAFREEAQRVCMYMHTSGSTGMFLSLAR
jgi:acyl-coenzyme A synthetase/AMP-(fatty) acid ligase